jgi:hypothetical protein
MDYDAVLAQVLALLQQEQRVAYRILKRRLQLDDETLEDLKDDLIYAKKLAADEDGRVLVWTGDTVSGAAPAPAPTREQAQAPLAYTPPLSGRKDSHLPQCPGRRTQTGHGALCRPERFHRVNPRP